MLAGHKDGPCDLAVVGEANPVLLGPEEGQTHDSNPKFLCFGGTPVPCFEFYADGWPEADAQSAIAQGRSADLAAISAGDVTVSDVVR